MKIYLFRHAKKAMDFSGDPELAAEGFSQASKIVDKVLKKELPTPTEIWVSPKKRAIQTLRPLAEQLQISIQIEESLTEQHSDETIKEFRSRIEKCLLNAQTKNNGVIYMCSHFDWVAEAMMIIPCDTDLSGSEFSHWAPAQYAGFDIDKDGIFHFAELKRISE